MKREILLLIMIILTTSVSVLASDANLTVKGYQFASISSGEVLSPLMDVSLDGGTVVKPEGEPFSFWRLNVGDVADFHFRLPMDTDSAADDSATASVTNLQANILLYSEKPGQIARIRWNRQLMTDPATIITTVEPGKFLITIPLPGPKAENQLRILPVTDSILIQSVKLTYLYALPSSTIGDVTVTLLAPDQDLHELSDPLTFRWRASGPCSSGWISLEYRQQGSEQWLSVPGAESFDRQCPEWPTDELGSFAWTNHGLKSFPSVKITYHDGKSTHLVKLRTATEFLGQALKLTDENKFDEALAEVDKALELCPYDAKFQDGKKAIQAAKEDYLERQKREKADGLFQQVQKLTDENNFDEAQVELNKVLELYPDDAKYKVGKKTIQTAKEVFLERQKREKADGLFQQAQKLTDEKNFDEALAEVDKALELYPDEAKYKDGKKVIQATKEDFLERQKREKADGLFQQVQKLTDERKFDEAQLELNKVLELYPDEAKYKAGKKAIQTAKEDFLERQKREKADGLFQQAHNLADERKFDEALVEVNKALELYPDDAEYKDFNQRLSSDKYRFQTGKNGGDRACLTVNGVEFAFRYCPAGTFTIGGEREDWNGRWHYMSDSHTVTLSKGFWMLETEITVGMFNLFLKQTGYVSQGSTPFGWTGSRWKQNSRYSRQNPGFSQTENCPVTCVSWNDAQAFNEWLGKQVGMACSLPTEAQWEYACRAGTTEAYAGSLDSMAWYSNTSSGKTHPVGTKQPNAWGISDMHGNVWEWCSDWYGDYPDGSVTDPAGAANGVYRVNRSGSWYDSAKYCRSAYRNSGTPSDRYTFLGFRPVLFSGSGN